MVSGYARMWPRAVFYTKALNENSGRSEGKFPRPNARGALLDPSQRVARLWDQNESEDRVRVGDPCGEDDVAGEGPQPSLRETERREPPERMIVESRADSFAPVRREDVERP